LPFLEWLAILFKLKRRRTVKVPAPDKSVKSEAVAQVEQKTQHDNAQVENEVKEDDSDILVFPEVFANHNNLDNKPCGVLVKREQQLLVEIGTKVVNQDYSLPNLPSTSTVVLDLASNPNVFVNEIAEAIEIDPVLSSELLKSANSVLYGGTQEISTLKLAVMRLGLRNLRALILAISMKNVISKKRGLVDHAEEVWRQSLSIAKISRNLAPVCNEDPEKAFLVGLIHNIGKVALIDILGRVITSGLQISRPLIGRMYSLFHEKTGAAMAEKWNLPQEVCSVAGCHHNYRRNKDYMRSAALVSLAHKMDLFLSLTSRREYMELMQSDEVEILGISEAACNKMFTETLDMFYQKVAEQDQVPV